MLFRSATLVSFDPPAVERGDLRVSNETIAARSTSLETVEGEEVIDLGGKLLMPAMVCAHTHLYSALARGMPAPP
ncbi:MAG TPA: ssnA protein, partial [Blastocatellia bacterium]|nr:ssnA protein [Blastocatellia bacterium]